MRRRLLKLLIILLGVAGFSIPVKAQLIRHTYQFFNTLATPPSECGPVLTPAQAAGNCNAGAVPGSFIADSLPHCGLSRPVYHTNLHWGLRYPNASGTITNTYTIHLYVKNTNWGNRAWVRIIDFSNGTSDGGIYFKNSGGSPNRCLDFYPNGIVGTCPYFNDSTYYLLTFTRNGATGAIDVYVNNTLFTTYHDAAAHYTGTAGTPIYIYRDDQVVTCESGEANFAYLSFTNQYSSAATVDSVYQHICAIANAAGSSDFSLSPSATCNLSQTVTVTYTGTIPPPGAGYTFNWDWDGGTVMSGSGMGPFVVTWNTPGTKNIGLTVTNNTCGTQSSSVKQIQIRSGIATVITQAICQGGTYLGYSAGGTYIDTFAAANGCDSIRTLNLTVKPKSFSVVYQSVCPGQSYLGYTAPGTYVDTLMAANGCDSVRTLHLTVQAAASSTIRQTICEGDSWLGHTTPGTYIDTLQTVNGCDSIRTLHLTVTPKPKPDLGSDKDLCAGDTLLLFPGVFSTYLWQDGSTQRSFIASQPGNYSVTVSNSCGSARSEMVIKGKMCDVYFPTAFTPDGDGKNDFFGPSNGFLIKDYELKVYNRWGQVVFQTKDYGQRWDATVGGQKQRTGVYVWYCTFNKNGVSRHMKGTILLIR